MHIVRQTLTASTPLLKRLRRRPSRRWPTWQCILAVALAYTLLGWLFLTLTVAHDYAAPLFPPAGIALGACLIFGSRIWPGIFIASIFVQLAAGDHANLSGTAWLGSVVVPFGATAQALAGRLLTRLLIGDANPLDSPRSTLRFLAIVAPLTCLVSCSFAIPGLLAAGSITLDDAAYTWWSWWLGDCLGVVIVTPLILAFLGRPYAAWRGRRLAIAFPMLTATLVLIVAFNGIRDWEAHRLQSVFAADADHIAREISNQLDTQLEMLYALDRLFAISGELDGHAFHDFVSPWLARHPGTHNFGWSPLIVAERRADFERTQAERLQRPDFVIRGRDAAGHTFPARNAAQYFPITLVEPASEGPAVIGLDPSVLPSTAAPIAQAHRTRLPVVSEALHLVQEAGRQRAVVVYSAVFDNKGREKGVLSAVMRMDDILFAVDTQHDPSIERCLSDVTAAPENTHLSGPNGCEQDGWRGPDLSWQRTIPFGGRTWRLKLHATHAYVSTHRSWAAWSTFASGLLVMDLLAAFLLLSSARTRRIEALVEQRTAQINEIRDNLATQQAALAQAQRVARIGSWEWDPERGHLHCSDELTRLLGLDNHGVMTLDTLIGRMHAEDRPHLRNALDEAYGSPDGASVDCRLNGTRHDTQATFRFTIERAGVGAGLHGLRGTVQDITAERRAEAHIHYLAHYDGLTGLPNRSLWLERARASLSVQRPDARLAVLLLDLDQFKMINDSLGHSVGDQLLTSVAERLRACLGEQDVLARIGGDEFVALLSDLASSEHASLQAQRILGTMTRPFLIDQRELSISLSIGIALYPDDGHDVETLLKHADTAMYMAKENGRNTFCYFAPGMNARALQRLMLESALRRAVEREELILYYQPQVSAADGRLIGCEALVRWRHPEMGLIGPIQFIPIAEECGLIHALGAWVFREACRQQLRWYDAGHGMIDIAVNISALQFRQTNFVDSIVSVLKSCGTDPSHIELEITESALMQPTEELLGRLQQLRDLGLNLALDDFGTGYSSLSYLKRLPIARIKLDRSFVKDLPDDLDDAAIASATLSMARDLGLEVVAEGVETEAQRDFLNARQCLVLQGYLYGHPEPADRFAAKFLQGREHPSV